MGVKHFLIEIKNGHLDLTEEETSQLFTADKKQFHKSIGRIFEALIQNPSLSLVSVALGTIKEYYFTEELGILIAGIKSVISAIRSALLEVISEEKRDDLIVGLWALLLLSIDKVNTLSDESEAKQKLIEQCEEMSGILEVYPREVTLHKKGKNYLVNIESEVFSWLDEFLSSKKTALNNHQSMSDLEESLPQAALVPPPPPYPYELAHLRPQVLELEKLYQSWNQEIEGISSSLLYKIGLELGLRNAEKKEALDFFYDRLIPFFRDNQPKKNKNEMAIWKKYQNIDPQRAEYLLGEGIALLEGNFLEYNRMKNKMALFCRRYADCLKAIQRDFEWDAVLPLSTVNNETSNLHQMLLSFQELNNKIKEAHLKYPETKNNVQYNPDLPPSLPSQSKAVALEEQETRHAGLSHHSYLKRTDVLKRVLSRFKLVIDNDKNLLNSEKKPLQVDRNQLVEWVRQKEDSSLGQKALELLVNFKRKVRSRRPLATKILNEEELATAPHVITALQLEEPDSSPVIRFESPLMQEIEMLNEQQGRQVTEEMTGDFVRKNSDSFFDFATVSWIRAHQNNVQLGKKVIQILSSTQEQELDMSPSRVVEAVDEETEDLFLTEQSHTEQEELPALELNDLNHEEPVVVRDQIIPACAQLEEPHYKVLARIVSLAVDSYTKWYDSNRGNTRNHGAMGQLRAKELREQVNAKEVKNLVAVLEILKNLFNNKFKDRNDVSMCKGRWGAANNIHDHSLPTFLFTTIAKASEKEKVVNVLNKCQGNKKRELTLDTDFDYTQHEDRGLHKSHRVIKAERKAARNFFEDIDPAQASKMDAQPVTSA